MLTRLFRLRSFISNCRAQPFAAALAISAGETYACSLEEEAQMLAILPKPAATVVAAAAFTGARRGEIGGFTWANYNGSEIRVEKSVWRSQPGEPKRPKSKGAIPVIAQLKLRLDQHWERCGKPRTGFIFCSELGNPMNLEALALDVVRPALEKANLSWHGWHAFRRGLAQICTDSEFPTR